MTISMKKMTCRALVVSLLALSFQSANAGMIGADQAAAAGAAQTDRGMVMSVLARAETAQQLQAQGIDPTMARERVAAMTDQEVHALAQDIQTAPAGALTSGGWIAVVVIAGLIWYFAYRR
ncbi:PA2779 family protein [Caenimonas aquaedulcis]|uniref:PA2779 family protein n=1 Tax=Caenimonas aquaedulcis TaxID=2793270 RepID=A0A931H3F5_9BURK|nr:PA2779 family protein [Caenimonas aquaedulcis]MBG9387788.1 PA2779 family protein [Caenimonas aquaedulcis]